MCSVWIEVIARPEMETENLGNILSQPILYKELRELGEIWAIASGLISLGRVG